ncbi:MAG: hypothetical protein NTY53_06570 [Kiritimatiellaeota bacterium]|nr:hypothetical protein [Kiritimatiellota bacterium]
MADVKFLCSQCHQHLEAPSQMAGELIDCPACKTPIEVPFPQQASQQIAAYNRGQKTRPCPYCGEAVLAVAIKCKHCGSDLTAGGEELAGTNALSVLIIVLLVLLGMFWLAIGLLQLFLSYTLPQQLHDLWVYGLINILISIWNLSRIASIVQRKKGVVGSLVFLGVVGSLFGAGQLLLLGAWLQIIPIPLYIILAILAGANKNYFKK